MYFPLFFCFSFYRSAALPVLPSFPTRRSSDLSATLLQSHLATLHDTGKVIVNEGDVDVAMGRAAKVDINVTFVKDRKSTRLNSSHGYISYAVFCLKKKKK